MGQPSTTIFVDNVGTPHTFIKLDDGNGGVQYYGFAPSSAGSPGVPPVRGNVGEGLATHAHGDPKNERAGYIDDAGWSKTIPVTVAQHDAMKSAVLEWRNADHSYNGLAKLGGENCTTFVQAIAKAGGITDIVTSRAALPISLIPPKERDALFIRDENGNRSFSDAMKDPLNTPGTPAYEFKRTNPELFKTEPSGKSAPDAATSRLHQNQDGSFTQVSTQQVDDSTWTTTTNYSGSGAVTDSMTVIGEYDREESWWRERSIATTYDAQGNETVSHRDYVDRLTHTMRTQPDGDTTRTDFNYSGNVSGRVEFDGANNSPYRWTSTSFDMQGREAKRVTKGDDGTQHDIEFDPHGHEDWRQLERLYDANGKEDWVRITQDDGAIHLKDFDQKNERGDRVWESLTDAQGREDWQQVTHDDGAVHWKDFDQKNERGDRIWERLTDVQGREDWQRVTQDDGSVRWTDFDQKNERSDRIWENMTDAQGREDWRLVTFDDNQTHRTDFDQDGSQRWSRMESHFGANGRVEYSTTYNDDGSRLVIDHDYNNHFGEHGVITYSAAGKAHLVGWIKDGFAGLLFTPGGGVIGASGNASGPPPSFGQFPAALPYVPAVYSDPDGDGPAWRIETPWGAYHGA